MSSKPIDDQQPLIRKVAKIEVLLWINLAMTVIILLQSLPEWTPQL